MALNQNSLVQTVANAFGSHSSSTSDQAEAIANRLVQSNEDIANQLVASNEAVADKLLESDDVVAKTLDINNKTFQDIATIRFARQKRWNWIIITSNLMILLILTLFTIAFFRYAIIVRT